MRATVGDTLVIRGHRAGEPVRKAMIVDVRGSDGSPPYVVVWGDDPGEHLFYPGGDVEVRPATEGSA